MRPILIGPWNGPKNLKKNLPNHLLYLGLQIDQIFQKRGNFWVVKPFFSYEHQLSGVQSEQAMKQIVGEDIHTIVHDMHFCPASAYRQEVELENNLPLLKFLQQLLQIDKKRCLYSSN